MVQVNRTAEDVANMETELYELRNDRTELRRTLTIAETERNMLKVENVMLQKKADERLERMTKVEAMMMHLASGLAAGLKEMREERELARAVHRASQEQQLEVGSDARPAPAFLRPDNFQVGMTNPKPPYFQSPRDAEDERDRLRGAAERIAEPPPAIRPPPPPTPPSPRRAVIDHMLADRDARMPEMGEYRPTIPPAQRRVEDEQDQANLRRLADRMG